MSIPERHRALAHEFVDGVEIVRLVTVYPFGGDRWVDDPNPTWDERFEYHRKPRAKVKKWLWTYKSAHGVFVITDKRMSVMEMRGYVIDYSCSDAQKIDASIMGELDE